MKKTAIVIDVDNTLVKQSKRKQAVLEDLFEIKVSIDEIEKDFDLTKILSDIAKRKGRNLDAIKTEFARRFFGVEHNDPNNFDCIEKAPEYLEQLAKNYEIIYLSARDYRLKEKTREQLKHYGFPVVEDDQLVILPEDKCPKEWTGSDLERFDEMSSSFKAETLHTLKTKYEIIAGIGDSFSDLKAYNLNDILSVIIRSPARDIEKQVNESNKSEKYAIDKYSYIVLDTWEEIYRYILAITSRDDKLEKICTQHSSDYSKWMYDLDNKAYLILVAATFCITSFLSLLNNFEFQPLLFKMIVLGGIITSALSMFFAVQAFASRNTHGRSELKDGDKYISAIKRLCNKMRNFLRVLFGKPPLYTRSMADVIQSSINKDQVNKSEYARVAYLKYFKERYRRLDPKEIASKTLFALRDANYKKISSERYARLFLNITLVIMVIVSTNYILAGLFDNNTYSGTVNSEEYYIADTGSCETILQLDDSCFEPGQLRLSKKAEQLLQEACKDEDEHYLICEIVSEETYANDRIKNYYNSIKYELIKEYINYIQAEKDVIIIAK